MSDRPPDLEDGRGSLQVGSDEHEVGGSAASPERESIRGMSVREAFAQQPLPPDADWRWWEAFLALAAAFVASALAGGAASALVPESAGGVFLASAVADIVMVVVLVGWLQVFHAGWAVRMGQPTNRGLDIVAGAVTGMGLHVLALLLEAFVMFPLLNWINGEEVPAPVQVGPGLSTLGLVVAAIFAIFIAPVTEEFFFRGILFRSLRTHRGFVFSGVVSGVLFGAIHILGDQPFVSSLMLMVPLAVVGFGFAWIQERRGSFLAAVSAHVAFNIIGFLGIVMGR